MKSFACHGELMRVRFRREPICRLAIAAGALLLTSGCNRGILDPVGPVGAAEKTILINSTAIMLAIIIPTMIATIATVVLSRNKPCSKYRKAEAGV